MNKVINENCILDKENIVDGVFIWSITDGKDFFKTGKLILYR
jgi:deoxyribose-phosphate aldolase